MIYSYGGRVDDDSNAITVIDEENVVAETKGYVNGEYVEFGGGGSSDFSTAEVTTANGVYANFLSGIADAPMSPSFKYIGKTSNDGVDGDYLIVLYQGNAILQTDPGQTYSIDGGIESLGSGAFKVTGDCTITIS